MKKVPLLLSLLLLSSQAHSNNMVRLNGLRVVTEGFRGTDKLRSFNWSKGTTIACLAHVSNGGIISIDDESCDLEIFSDNKGTDLMGAKASYASASISGWNQVSDDSKMITFEINSRECPGVGASELYVKGKVGLNVATSTIKLTSDLVEVKEGHRFLAGDLSITIASSGKPQWGGAKQSIVLKFQKNSSDIAKITFFDEAGKEFESHQVSTMAINDSFEASFNFQNEVKIFKLEVELWEGTQRVIIPFDVKATIGL